MNKEFLDTQDFIGILTEIQKIMAENRDFLCQLDGELGDGDLGLTMSKGFEAIVRNLPEGEEDVGKLLVTSGLTMADSASSTMGTLLASALIQAGKASNGKSHIYVKDLLDIVQSMEQAIMKRGKSRIGEKTILDAIGPAREAIEQAHQDGDSLDIAILKAYVAAEAGTENTKKLMARQGRAARYLDRSIGQQDPGATAACFLFQGFLKYIQTG
jgi:phosphoenolpyruvate---glycerone phosphotransferase subunit DhaL